MSTFLTWQQQGRQWALRMANLRRRQPPRAAVTVWAAMSVAVLTLVSSSYQQQQQQEETPKGEKSGMTTLTDHHSNSNRTSRFLSTVMMPLTLQRTHCDGWLSYLTRGGKSKEQEQQETTGKPSRKMTNLEIFADKGELEDRYDVDWKQPIGEGNFGLVYKARDRVTGEWVALKEIPKTAENDETFRREIDAFLYVRQNGGHSNICQLQANYEKNGYSYLVLDYIEGGEMCKYHCQSYWFLVVVVNRHQHLSNTAHFVFCLYQSIIWRTMVLIVKPMLQDLFVKSPVH